MADPLDGRAPLSRPGRFTLAAAPPAARFVFRGGAAALACADAGFGVALPRVAGRAATAGARAALWLGPDEWLLLAPRADAARIAQDLAAALGDTPHALVEIGDRQTGLRLEGPRAATILAAGCPLDLDPARFPVDSCTRTLFAKAEIVLWRIAEAAFHVELRRSFAAYGWDALAEAAREHCAA